MKALLLAVAAMLILVLQANASETMRIHFINVGQGAATLVEFPCAAILIDAGGEKNVAFDGTKELIDYLDDFFVGRPDLQGTLHLLALTHPHIDHTRGVKAVISRYRVLNAIDNGAETGSGRHGQIALHSLVADSEETGNDSVVNYQKVAVRRVVKGIGATSGVIDPVNCATIDPKITALWGHATSTQGWKAEAAKNQNNHSVVLRVDFGKASFLVSGDLELAGIAAMLDHHKGSDILKTDVLHVSHHGAANGVTPALLTAIQPKIAFIATSANERELSMTGWAFGHPRKTTVADLASVISRSRPPTDVAVATGQHKFENLRLTKAIYGTGWDGSVVLEADTKGNWRVDDRAPVADSINLNTATVEELITLPMIGHKRAEAIVQSRERNGRFQSVEDLMRIPGIKAGTVEALRDLVSTD